MKAKSLKLMVGVALLTVLALTGCNGVKCVEPDRIGPEMVSSQLNMKNSTFTHSSRICCYDIIRLRVEQPGRLETKVDLSGYDLEIYISRSDQLKYTSSSGYDKIDGAAESSHDIPEAGRSFADIIDELKEAYDASSPKICEFLTLE